jgi:hypothetical protein
MKWKIILVVGAMFVFVFTSAQAQSFNLDFDSLPSSQGWIYSGNLAENSAFSADGITLAQATVGSGGNSIANYRMFDIVDPNKLMALTFTARVISHEQVSFGSFGLGFNFIIRDGGIHHRLGMTDNLLQVDDQFLVMDTTVFHDYIFILNPGGNFELFVDGVFIASGNGLEIESENFLLFGDSTSAENTDAEITSMSFVVIGLTDLIESLIDDIEALNENGGLQGNRANGLIVKLGVVLDSLDRENTTSGCNQLLAFINEVAALVSSGTLGPEEGQALLDSANAILEQIGC